MIVSLVAGGGLVYYLKFRNSSIKATQYSEILTHPQGKQQEVITFSKLNSVHEESTLQQTNPILEQMKKQLKVTYDGGILDIDMIVELQGWVPEVLANEWIQFTLKSRIDRRSQKKINPQQYLVLIGQFSEGSEKIIERGLDDMLKTLEISKEVYEESLVSQIQKGFFQQLVMIKANSEQKLKSKIPSKKQLNLDQVKQILRFQVDVLKSKPEQFQNFIKMLEGNQEKNQLIPTGITAMLSDMIYEQYQVEEEDQLQVMSDPCKRSQSPIFRINN